VNGRDGDPGPGPYELALPAPLRVVHNAFDLARDKAEELHRLSLIDSASANSSAGPFAGPDLNYQVYRMLVTGWHPEAIAAHLETTYNQIVPTEVIIDFKNKIDPQLFIPPTYLRERYKNLDLQIDPLAEINRVLFLMQERLGASVLLEEIDGIPSPGTTDLVESYFNMLHNTALLQNKLGTLGKPQPAVEAGAEARVGGGLPSLRLLLEVHGAGNDPVKLRAGVAAQFGGDSGDANANANANANAINAEGLVIDQVPTSS